MAPPKKTTKASTKKTAKKTTVSARASKKVLVTKKKTATKKSTAKKPAKKNDEALLESAVGDLAKQTEALLGKSGEKISKPVLPKKQNKPSTKRTGKKSFDIIHPNEATSSGAILKSPHPGQKLIEAHEDDEATDAPVPKVEKSSSASSAPAIVNTHNPGSLNVMSKKSVAPIKRGVAAVQAEQEDESEAEQIVPVKRKAAEEKSADDPEAVEETKREETPKSAKTKGEKEDEPVAFSSMPDKAKVTEADDSDDDQVLEADTESISDDTKPSDTVSEATKSIQLQSDNLDDDEESDEPKPVDVYDTDEYHPTLHDWSKLSKQSHTPLYILLLLMVILGAVLYIVYADISIPFLPL